MQSQLVAVLLALVSRILNAWHHDIRNHDDETEFEGSEIEMLQSSEDFEALCMVYCVVLRTCLKTTPRGR